eukprot:CAMPEP_0185619982 /NCGR_PEP_ID=MMETSP0436-20130131/52505_1 /TAXON_ID=626734 ORGANISM="Favella taraikaensis, Strain Fe Narragansett Bay" /NCGR_SAMPLE_ID=MMETSP0436 /ASSEMBLY_ACC=CAM_ASM_000390 /LENGTH=59 /DNA_ID=CAMNT_0028259945 /DNA_START=68 /DNA_END=243 /DNA_ORIENTATION=+
MAPLAAPDANNDLREHRALLYSVFWSWATLALFICEEGSFADLARVVKDDDMEPNEPAE